MTIEFKYIENQSFLSSSLLNWKKSLRLSLIDFLDSISISVSVFVFSSSILISFFEAKPSKADSFNLSLHNFMSSAIPLTYS